jgi:hypothetical protein
MADLIESCRRKLADQAADLVNKAKMPPLLVANLLFEVASAVALTVVDVRTVARAFQQHGESLEEIAAEDDDKVVVFKKPGPFVC